MKSARTPKRPGITLPASPADASEVGASTKLLVDDEADDDGSLSLSWSGKHDENNYDAAETSSNGGDRSRYLRLLSIIFAIILFGIIGVSSFEKLLYTSRNTEILDFFEEFGDGNGGKQSDNMLGIRLHPEDHANRAPRTIVHHWCVTSDYRSPDGVKKKVYLVNGIFPGPTIECRSGDRLVIRVTNELSAEEGVSIHWHGLHMRGFNSMDGAAGFTQCPIPVGKTFAYEFDVDQYQYGSFWWHAHSEVQRGDGMYGGLVVHKPSRRTAEIEDYKYERDMMLLIGDWYHRSAGDVLDWYTSIRGFGNEAVPDSMLVNGIGRFICSMAVPARPVECSDIEENKIAGLLGAYKEAGPVRLRVVNVGSLAGFTLRLSSGTFIPISLDGGWPILPSPASSVGILYPGERVDLLLKPLGNNTFPSLLHINLDPENFKFPNPALRPNQSFPLLPISHTASVKDEEEQALDNISHFDLSSTTAAEDITSNASVPSFSHQTILLYTRTEKLSKFGNHPMGFINRTSWELQRNPGLPLISLSRSQWDSNQLIPWIPLSEESETWVDIVLNNLDDGAHPFHFHGHDFYILSSHRSEHGWGSYSPYSLSGASAIRPNLNLKNPPRKDTVAVPRRGYVILRFRANNPGIWMLHCHVLFHQASGMAMGFLVGGDNAHDKVETLPRDLCQKVD